MFFKRTLVNPSTDVVMHKILAHVLTTNYTFKSHIKSSTNIYLWTTPPHTLDTGGAGMNKTLYT